MTLAISNIESSVTVVQNNQILPFPIVTASGGSDPLRFTIQPRLPAGMFLNIGNGELAGTPGQAPAPTLYEITVEDTLGANAKTNVEIVVHVPQANLVSSNIMADLNMTQLTTAITTIEDREGNDDNFQVYGQAGISTLGFTRFRSNVNFDDRLTADHAYYIHRYL
jgi:hypothetical protein